MSLGSQPRLRLGTLPTPLHEAPRLRAALGGPGRCPRILVKRDDLTGLALGGNKVRKLEFIVGEALRDGATFLVTTGAAQSNYCRLTAAAARVAGMGAALVLGTTVDQPELQGNLLLDTLLGAELHFFRMQPGRSAAAAARAEVGRVDEVLAGLRARGERPCFAPVGGSTATGALGYVAASLELTAQLADAGESPSWLYYASGSRGTQAGLAVGARLYGAPYRLRGIAVSGGESEKRELARRIAGEAAARLGRDVRLEDDELITDEGYIGEGYGIPSPAAIEAIRLLARTEAIFLDPVYSAKAMAGLIDHVRRGILRPDETVVFLHTGGAPALFAHTAELA
jgi:D-cysteine desulfhydrase family pyridoxal phosphate-dependent enzyme